jgi:hypothetical protein
MASDLTMSSFQTEREAKEYLIAQIVGEAEREAIPLSDIERKMLYFSETGWTLPNILKINAEFEPEYDNDEYEQKIAGLVREIEKRNEAENKDAQSTWDDAVAKLSEGDHYLLVLIDLGPNSTARWFSKWLPATNSYGTGKGRPPGDLFRLIVVALVLGFAMFAAVVIESWLKK